MLNYFEKNPKKDVPKNRGKTGVVEIITKSGEITNKWISAGVESQIKSNSEKKVSRKK